MASNENGSAKNSLVLKVLYLVALFFLLFIVFRPSTDLKSSASIVIQTRSEETTGAAKTVSSVENQSSSPEGTGETETLPSVVPQASSSETTDAAKKLFKWQAGLIERTAAIYNRESRAKYTEPRNGGKWGDDDGNALPVDPEGHGRFDLFDAFIDCPDGMVLERVGPAGDGGKMICSIGRLQPPCTVYSLGSMGDTGFESAVLMQTQCNVITFDCTVDLQPIHARHRFEKKCIGNEEKVRSDPEHFETIQDSMKRLGVEEISLLKMDIEGYEYDVMSSWTRDVKDYLPRQISFELHFGGMYYGTPPFAEDVTSGVMFWPRRDVSLGELALLGYHLANLGYGIVSREDNYQCPHCSELTLYKIA